MTDNIPKICAAFEMWQNNDCIKAGTTLELIMRYLADDPEIDVVVSSADQDRAYRDYIGRQNENLNAKTMIIRELNTHVAQLKSEQTIDDECVGCCKQEELDECKERNDNRGMVIERLKEEIDSLDAALLDRDNIIVNLNKTIDDNGSDYEIMRTNHCNTVAKLEDDISSLEAELSARKGEVTKQYETSHKHSSDIGAYDRGVDALCDVLNDFINARETDSYAVRKLSKKIIDLEAEISVWKEDSKVLMKVVEAIRDLQNLTGMVTTYDMRHIRDMVQDYLDAPEGPPDPFIDDSCIGCERLDALNECKEQIHTQKLTIESLLKETPQVADLKQSLEAASVVLTKTENELSVCKEDSVVLTKVVEIVKNWDDSTGRAFPTLIKILDELVDYTDAPEGPPETPIDDLYRVSVFLEMP